MLTTSKNQVVSLIKKLRPFRTDKYLMRMGPDGDGGYLLPDDLEGILACFSPGVGHTSAFELECIERGMQVFLADYSVDGPPASSFDPKMNFIKKHIGCTTNEVFTTMDDWVNGSKLKNSSELLLQMDIEGAEYMAFINMTDRLINRFRIMLVEFHNLQELWNPHFYGTAETVFNKILQTHTCVHIHPNNCCGIDERDGVQIPRVAEFTFFHHQRIKGKVPEHVFPNPYDRPNLEGQELVLPRIWFE